MVTFDPVCYSVNSTAMGDVLAAVPVVKYAIEKYHKDCDYRVVASSHFRCFFHFVPDSKFLATNDTTWKFDKKYSIRRLNDVDAKNGHLCRLTPAKMMLSHYASIGLTGEILPRDAYAYVPLPEVDVSKFGVDFTKAVVLVVSYRDLNRSIPSEDLVKIATYVQSRGYIPVYIGRTVDGAWKERPPVSPFIPPAFGVDLRNKTTIPELATIMSKAIAVCGVDSGPVHLAGTTSTTLIASYTNVDWRYRIPTRLSGRTIVIEPDPECRYCSSHWAKDFYNFLNCYYGHNNCTKTLRAEKFIRALSLVFGEQTTRLNFSAAWDIVKPALLGQKKLQILHSEMLQVEAIAGDIAEIGVFKGTTSQFMNLIFPERKLHCYDTFAGATLIDPTVDTIKVGEYKASLEDVKKRVGNNNVSYYDGEFPTSFKDEETSFAFVHCDLDTYLGTKAALERVFPKLVPNGVMLIDDFSWPNALGVEKAVREWLAEHKHECSVREYEFQIALTKKG